MGRVGQKIVRNSKTPTNFCPKIMMFPKKKRSSLEIRLRFFTFCPKITLFSNKKKEEKRSLPEISPRLYTFGPKS